MPLCEPGGTEGSPTQTPHTWAARRLTVGGCRHRIVTRAAGAARDNRDALLRRSPQFLLMLVASAQYGAGVTNQGGWTCGCL
jgi:hypothetical protein